MAATLLISLACLWAPVAAQVGREALPRAGHSAPDWAGELPSIEDGWATLVAAGALAAHLDLLMSEAEGILTLRGPHGILTLFQDSPDALWRPAGSTTTREESLSAAVRRREDGWWLPADVLSYFNLWLHDGVAEGPDGLILRLTFPPPPAFAGPSGELVDLGSGVPGLRLFADGADASRSQSLLLADAGLLGLAMPEQRRSFDDLVARSGSDKPLLIFVTSSREGPWDARIEFSQGGRAVEARFPFRLKLLEGNPAAVGPDSPVIGVVLLPAEFNLRRPIDVRWAGASATVTFRR